MKMRKLLALLLALVMSMSLIACGGSDKEDASSGEDAAATETLDTLVVYSSGAFQGAWDPTKNSILSNKHLEYQVYDCLLNYDAEANLTPNIATSWEYLEDGYTLRIYLNQGVKFHDGSELTAQDVIDTMVYMTRPDSSRFADYGCAFDGAVVDDYTVDIWPTNETPLASLLTLLAHDPILSSDDIANATLDVKMNGTGPYMFAKYENETVYLEAFADYWNPARAAKVPFAEYKYVPESSTRMASLQAGEAHVIERVDIEQVPVLEADSNVVVTEKLSEEQRYIIFKTTQDVMGNELVREAIAHAVDRETIANDILQGYGVLADSYLPKVSNLYAPIDNMIQYNPERAAELLAEAGYPGGEGLPKIKYITSTGLYPKSKEIGEYITSNLTAIGLDIELVVEETAIWEQHLYEEDSCLMCDTGWMNVGGATNFILGTHYRGPGRCNFSSYPEVDAALDAESTCTDPEARKDIIQNQLYPLLVETNTNMPLFDSVLVYAYSANLQGLEIMPTSNVNFAALSLG